MIKHIIQALAPSALRAWLTPEAFSCISSLIEPISYKCTLTADNNSRQLAKF